MSSWRAFCETAHIVCLGIWVGAVSIAAATAAVAFPALKGLQVRIPDLPEPSQSEAFRFAAGSVAQTVFLIGDTVAFACSLVAAVTLLLLIAIFRLPARRPATIIRAVAVAIALASLASIMLIVSPQINTAARMHYEAAKNGDAAAAQVHRQAVDDLHPIARNLYAAEIVAALTALLAGTCSLAKPWRGTSAAPAPSPYPEPALLSRKRL